MGGRTHASRVRRHHLAPCGGIAARAGRQLVARRGAVVDVLRTVQPRTLHRRSAILAHPGTERTIEEEGTSRFGVARKRKCRACGDGKSSVQARLVCGRALLDRRYRALRLYPLRRRRRLRPRALSCGQSLARPRARATRIRSHVGALVSRRLAKWGAKLYIRAG